MTDNLPMLGIILIAIIGFFNMMGSLFKHSTEVSQAQMRLSWRFFMIRFGLIGVVCCILLGLLFKVKFPSYSDIPYLGEKMTTASMISLPQSERDESTASIDAYREKRSEKATPRNVNIENTTPSDKKRYKAGDTYIKNGVAFILVDKEKYQKNNIDHFPTIVLNGVEYYLTRRDRSRPSRQS